MPRETPKECALPYQPDFSPCAEVLWQPGTDLLVSISCTVQAFWDGSQNRQRPRVSPAGLCLPRVSLCWGRFRRTSRWIVPSWLFHVLSLNFSFQEEVVCVISRNASSFPSLLLGCALPCCCKLSDWPFLGVLFCFAFYHFSFLFVLVLALHCFSLLTSFSLLSLRLEITFPYCWSYLALHCLFFTGVGSLARISFLCMLFIPCWTMYSFPLLWKRLLFAFPGFSLLFLSFAAPFPSLPFPSLSPYLCLSSDLAFTYLVWCLLLVFLLPFPSCLTEASSLGFAPVLDGFAGVSQLQRWADASWVSLLLPLCWS